MGFLSPAALIMFAFAAASAPAAPDAKAGATMFKQRCQMCHTVTAGQKSGIGPNLAGIAGRPAGSAAFSYSPAMKKSRITWTKPSLERFLAAPAKMVPGTRMTVSVADANQRANIVAYLGTLKK